MTSRTEEEELAVIKEWWQRNGKPLLTGGALALAIVLGWQAWTNYQSSQAQNASWLYQQLLETVLTESGQVDPARVAAAAEPLQKNFAGTVYAQYGSLFVAKVAVDTGKLDDAAAELQLVLDNPADATIAELARQRLARVLAAQDKAEEGLALLLGDTNPAFAASREELKGDLLLQLGRPDEAFAAYQQAKESLAEDASQGTLQLKLDDLAKGDA